MSKRVAVIGTRGYPSYYGGFETLVRRLVPHLADDGWEVAVYGRRGATRSDDPARDPRIARIITPGVESKSLSTLSYGLTACLHAAWRRPDVVLVMNVANGYWLPFLAARGIPTVVNVDGIEWERAKWGRAAKAVFRGGARLTARWGGTLVCDSLEIARRWHEGFGRTSEFIPYGGTTAAPDPLPDLPRRGYALLVARFVPENTVVEFFDAAGELSKDWPVVIVGSSGYGGELDERARQLAADHPGVRWLGHLSDDEKLFALWHNAGAYFHGHSIGGTNPALVQAMACGAPVVARDTVYNREVLGDAGRFVAPDARSIAEGLRAVLSDPPLQDRLGAAAFDRQQQSYTWKLVLDSYSRALEAAR